MFHRIVHDPGSGGSAVCDENRVMWCGFPSRKKKADYGKKDHGIGKEKHKEQFEWMLSLWVL